MAFALFTMAEAARHLKIKKATLRCRVKAASIRIYKVGSVDVIMKEDLDALEGKGEPARGRRPKAKLKT